MNRAQTIDWLVANCDCWRGANETLNKMSDEQLGKIKTGADKAKASEITANAATKGFTDSAGVEHVWNAEKAAFEPKPKPTPAPEVPAANRLTAEEQEDLAFARAERLRQKQAMVDRLTANVADAAAKAAAATVYQGMKPEQLAALVQALPVVSGQTAAPSYYGAAVPPPVANAQSDESEDVLPLPVWNYERTKTA